MSSRKGRPFYAIEGSTSPAFSATADNTAGLFKLESASTVRIWAGGSNRAVRTVNSDSSASYFLKFGTSTVVAASSDSILVPGTWPQVLYVTPTQSYVSIVSSTTVNVNVTIGYAG